MTEEEVRLANAWYTEDGLPPSAIAERLGRDKSVLTRLLVKQVPQKKQGRPPSLSQAQVTYLKRLLDKMVRKADCKYTVTAAMLKKAAKLKVGERVIRDALHQQKVYFRKLREKPVLTPEDVKDRLAFARKYHGKTPGWWNKQLHAIIDGKSFKVYLNADGRKKAAQHATYGAYRAPGQGQEPLTAAALARSREAKVKQARSSGKAEPRATELDLYPIIVRHGFRNGPDDCNAAQKLVSYLKAHGSPALQAFVKNRVKLSSLIDDVLSWETVDDFLALHAQSRLDTLKAAAGTACVCHGQWMQTAMHSLMLNGIDPAAFCQDIYCLLANGRREDVPVLVLMGRFGGKGKSFWLSPLRSVCGVEHVQATPQPGNFPLLGLERKKVVLLDDWSFDAEVLPLPTQLLWYEGKPFPLSRPQNSANYTGHILYQGSAPIFVTCKEKDLGPLQEKAHIAFLRGHPSEHTMLLRRLKVHSFHRPLPVRQSGNRIPECQRCFGQLVLQYGQT